MNSYILLRDKCRSDIVSLNVFKEAFEIATVETVETESLLQLSVPAQPHATYVDILRPAPAPAQLHAT